MGYLIAVFIILTFSVTISICFKKKIEETIPIGVVGIILITYLTRII